MSAGQMQHADRSVEVSKRTISEILFERFCRREGLKFSRIKPSESPGMKSPDYQIQSPRGPVIVEVKQFDPNAEDKRNAQLLEERGYGDAIGGEPGARARIKIQSGARQLKARSEGRFPTVLVLYNNVPFNSRGTDPYEIKTAMYGLEKVDLAVGQATVSVVDRGFGPKRKVTPSSNTSLSAVAVLYARSRHDLRLVVFHNIYAATPLGWLDLSGPRIVHLTLGPMERGAFQEWKRLDEDSAG
jgi:hypothetical protein